MVVWMHAATLGDVDAWISRNARLQEEGAWMHAWIAARRDGWTDGWMAGWLEAADASDGDDDNDDASLLLVVAPHAQLCHVPLQAFQLSLCHDLEETVS